MTTAVICIPSALQCRSHAGREAGSSAMSEETGGEVTQADRASRGNRSMARRVMAPDVTPCASLAAMPGLHTPLCSLLGLQVPLLQSGMARVAGPPLVAEVSRAGGLGILAGLSVPPDALRAQIRAVRERTDRPFGVNLWLHPRVRAPLPPEQLPPEAVAQVQEVLNAFRARLGLAPVHGPPPPAPPAYLDEGLEVILQERVPVWSIGLGVPTPEQVARCHAAGVLVVAMAASVEDAQALEAVGVDVLVAQGSEAGGHRSTWTEPGAPDRASVGTLALVPAMVDAVRVPVVAAGGIADGRGLVAALALGAGGVLMGTRFVATRESEAPPMWKDALLARGADDTVLTRAASGLWGRALRNALSEAFGAGGIPGLPGYAQRSAVQDVIQAAAQPGRRAGLPPLRRPERGAAARPARRGRGGAARDGRGRAGARRAALSRAPLQSLRSQVWLTSGLPKLGCGSECTSVKPAAS